MSRLLVTLSILVLAVASAGAGEYANVKRFPLRHPACRGFVVISEQTLQYRLYYVSPAKRLEVFPVLPEGLSCESIEAIVLSPKGDKVCFLSSGEGHPRLDVYRLDALLRYADAARMEEPLPKDAGDSAAPTKAEAPYVIGSVDPYPGVCDRPRWADNDCLEFVAQGVDLYRFDHAERRGAESCDSAPRTWRWNLVTDSFAEARTGARSRADRSAKR